MNLNTVPKMGPPGVPFGPHAQLSKRTKEKYFHGPIFGTVWRYQNETAKSQNPQKRPTRATNKNYNCVNQHIELEQRRSAQAKPDFTSLSGPEMEPESAHVVSAVCVPWLQCGDLRCSTTQATFTNPSLLRATPLLRAMF